MRIMDSIKRFMNGNPNDTLASSRKGRKFLVIYFLSLFIFSLLFILMSFLFSERKLSAYKSEQDQSVVSAMKSLDSLKSENDSLKLQVSSLEEQLLKLQNESSDAISSLKEENAALNEQLSKQFDSFNTSLSETDKRLRATELLWQLQKLYYEKKYTASRNIITYMEDEGLSSCLSDSLSGEYISISPYDAYTKIKEKLF